MEQKGRNRRGRLTAPPSLLSGALALWALTLGPTVAWGQGTGLPGQGAGLPGQTSPGYYVVPSLSVAESYDDNIFFRGGGGGRGQEDDFISSLIPRVEGGYISAPLTLLGHYSLAAQVFAKHPRLNNPVSAQNVGVATTYIPLQRVTLNFNAAYAQSQRPSEINVESNVEDGRRRSRRYQFSPALKYRFSQLLTGSTSYSFQQVERSGGATNDVHSATLRFARDLTTHDRADAGYQYRLFLPSGDELGNNTRRAFHVLTLGWTRQVSALTSASLQGGMRVSDSGSVGPEAQASVSHQLQYGTVGLAYARTQGTVAGRAGPSTIDRVSADVSYQLARYVSSDASLFFSRVARSGRERSGLSSETKSYGLRLGATYQLNQWLFLSALYQFRFQEGSLLERRATAGEDRYRNLVMIQLSASYPYRLY